MTKKVDNDRISLPLVLGVIFIASIIMAVAMAFFITKKGDKKIDIKLPYIGSKVKELEKLYEDGKPQEALDKLKKLPSSEQKSSENILFKGKLWYLKAWMSREDSNWINYARNEHDWFNNDDVNSSLYFLKQASLIEKTSIEADFYIALIYMEKGWFDRATNEFRSILDRSPKYHEALINYGVLMTRKHDYYRAIEIFKKGLEIYPKDTELLTNLFFVYTFHTEDYKEAVIIGNRFLKNADKKVLSLPKVKGELYDILTRFPEYEELAPHLMEEKRKIPKFVPRRKR